jgi:hypothetical protein
MQFKNIFSRDLMTKETPNLIQIERGEFLKLLLYFCIS